jgi:hypothetical protein
MRKNKVRPQYVKDLVEKTNERLRTFKIKEEGNDLFVFMCSYLLKKDMYEGFNYYKDEYNPYLDKMVSVLAGSYLKENYDYLQII